MKTYCFSCKKQTEYTLTHQSETGVIDGVEFTCVQDHAFCRECGNEVFPDEVVDRNVSIAHDAYRKALDIITVAEMKLILDRYNIGARPLSLLLGWGENTVERQMKHSLPDHAHSKALKELFEPQNMLKLLITNGDRITSVALSKTLSAVLENICCITKSDLSTKTAGHNACYRRSSGDNQPQPVFSGCSSDMAFVA